MSAWIVSKRHIDYMLSAGLALDPHGPLRWFVPVGATVPEGGARVEWRELTRETAGRVGVMLWAENFKSVGHRYGESDTETELYEFARYRGEVEPVQVLKAIECFEYQSCEHDEWERSEAHAFCEALRHAAINRLPGYEAAAWGIE